MNEIQPFINISPCRAGIGRTDPRAQVTTSADDIGCSLDGSARPANQGARLRAAGARGKDPSEPLRKSSVNFCASTEQQLCVLVRDTAWYCVLVRGPVHDVVSSFNHHFVRVDILTHLFGRRGRGRASQGKLLLWGTSFHGAADVFSSLTRLYATPFYLKIFTLATILIIPLLCALNKTRCVQTLCVCVVVRVLIYLRGCCAVRTLWFFFFFYEWTGHFFLSLVSTRIQFHFIEKNKEGGGGVGEGLREEEEEGGRCRMTPPPSKTSIETQKFHANWDFAQKVAQFDFAAFHEPVKWKFKFSCELCLVFKNVNIIILHLNIYV